MKRMAFCFVLATVPLVLFSADQQVQRYNIIAATLSNSTNDSLIHTAIKIDTVTGKTWMLSRSEPTLEGMTVSLECWLPIPDDYESMMEGFTRFSEHLKETGSSESP